MHGLLLVYDPLHQQRVGVDPVLQLPILIILLVSTCACSSFSCTASLGLRESITAFALSWLFVCILPAVASGWCARHLDVLHAQLLDPAVSMTR